jgi:hypothetical protein
MNPIDDEERKTLAATLAQAKDISILREAIRLAEAFLAAQLQAALAADLRAMTLAAVLAAIIGGLLGGTATIVAAAEIKPGFHLISILIFAVFLVAALVLAVHAARPTFFDYPGNNPKYFMEDIEQDKSLSTILAEQAAYYAQNIERNNYCIDQNHHALRRSLQLVLIAVMLGVGAEIVIILGQIARFGLGSVS